jgi:Fe2+ or Zn2+ uptake regulation protein
MNKKTIDNVGDYLKSNGIKPSFQRIRIFEYLLNSKEHPKVDDIYRELIHEIPTLSKTTVYNTLNLFMEKGIVHLVTIEGTENRYDVNIEDHGHFKCEVCGRVFDFEILEGDLKTDLPEGFVISQKDLFFRGTCADCSRKKD